MKRKMLSLFMKMRNLEIKLSLNLKEILIKLWMKEMKTPINNFHLKMNSLNNNSLFLLL
jgi:hypothetical protein